MRKKPVQTIIQSLNDSQVKYLIAGGLAVIAYGYLRFTADIDLIISLDMENLTRALSALKALGYQPRIPVEIMDFAIPDLRKQWIAEKNMQVFSLWNPEYQDTPVDIFVEIPFDFETEYQNAVWYETGAGVKAPFISLSCLIRLKEMADRDKDHLDLLYLKKIQEINHEQEND